MLLVLGCICAFLIGGVPFALVVVRLVKGIDLRTVGSGNVGATNASRAFASRTGRLVAFLSIYLLDAGKGFLPAWLGPGLLDAHDPRLAGALLGASSVLGHVFSPFLRCRGGKGVATATGVLFALDWQVTLVALAVFCVVRFLTGHVFFGSLALSLALAGAAVGMHPQDAFAARLPVTVLCLGLALLLFWTHRGNLRKYFAQKGAVRA
jgi:glycerol-3-phosphate acyltransferase PlsY